jgi:hypothetical protein
MVAPIQIQQVGTYTTRLGKFESFESLNLKVIEG